MKKTNSQRLTPARFVRILSIVIGLVLVWRGIWYALDAFDIAFCDDNHIWSAIGGTILGFIILYIPDRDLKEIEKL